MYCCFQLPFSSNKRVSMSVPYARPSIHERKFSSNLIEKTIQKVKLHFLSRNEPELAQLFENVFPNTLDTTVYSFENDTFIITGDIPAMWLRDSTNQVAPYMPLLNFDEKLKQMILGLIHRQAKCILSDPWANAFKEKPDGPVSQWAFDDTVKPPVSNLVFESKFELDSLAAFLKVTLFYTHS